MRKAFLKNLFIFMIVLVLHSTFIMLRYNTGLSYRSNKGFDKNKTSVMEFYRHNFFEIAISFFAIYILIYTFNIKQKEKERDYDDELDKQRKIIRDTELERDTDDVSGLLTRNAFIKLADSIIQNSPKNSLLMICLDIDHFKEINERLGYAEGDRLLNYIGSISKDEMKNGLVYLVCRARADIFYFLCSSNVDMEDKSKKFCEKIKAYDFPNEVHYHRGAYVICSYDMHAIQCMDFAITAMKMAKKQSCRDIVFFTEHMHEKILKEQFLLNNAEKGIENNEFVPFIQPKYDFSTNQIVGAESLVRWIHPELGMISPGEFVPLFEKNGFIANVDRVVFIKTCHLQKRLLKRGIEPAPISVNMSRYDIKKDDLVDDIKNIIEDIGISPKYLHIEITESLYNEEPEKLCDAVTRLRNMGFEIELDDYGSGYSSTRTLLEFPVDIIKLDMSLVKGVNDSYKNSLILASNVRMAKWLGMPVVAEGVENAAIAEKINSFGCKYMQGFYFSKPLKMEDYENLICKQKLVLTNRISVSRTKPVLAFESVIVADVFDTIFNSDESFKSIDGVLELLGKYFDMDSVFILEQTEDKKLCKYNYAWFSDNFVPPSDDNTLMQSSNLINSKICNLLNDNGIYAVEDVDALDDNVLKPVMQKRGIKSMMLSKLYSNGNFLACLGMSNFKKQTAWTDIQLETLRMISKIIGARISDIKLQELKVVKSSLENAIIKENELNLRLMAFSKLFYAAYDINLINGSYVELCAIDAIKKTIPPKGKISDGLKIFIDKILKPEFREKMASFTDSSTIEQRLEGKQFVYIDYLNVNNEYARSLVFPVDYDENGKLSRVMLVSRLKNDDITKKES